LLEITHGASHAWPLLTPQQGSLLCGRCVKEALAKKEDEKSTIQAAVKQKRTWGHKRVAEGLWMASNIYFKWHHLIILWPRASSMTRSSSAISITLCPSGPSRTSWDASFDHPYAGALKSNGTGIYCRPCQRCLAMTLMVIPHVHAGK
jgi:hypothetical protein